jgi:hypothetical protein
MGGGPYPITLPNMPFDTYTLTFNPISGYVTPAAQTQQLTPRGSIVFQGNYVASGPAGLGTITITTNLDAASFGVVSTSNTAFTPFTRSGKFFNTLATVPAGIYQINFTTVPGYYTPPAQTVTLAPGGAIQFSGIYSRILVALFTGFSDRPTINVGDDGVTYPDQCPVQGCPGMAALASELRADPTLAPGIYAKTFTFYDERDYLLNPVLGSLSLNCFAQTALTTPIDPACRPPLAGSHQIAQAWIGAIAPTPDDRIVILGHSYGGNRARLFAQQLLDAGYEVDGLVTADPIDWSVCGLFNAIGVLVDSDCNFSNGSPYIVSDSLHYLLSFTQTQSELLNGYYLAKLTLNYPYTILNDPACLPNLASVDYYCSHVHLASRSGQGGGTTGDIVHDDAIALVKAVQQSPKQALSQVLVSSITTTSATVSWMTEDDTLNGKVITSLDQNFKAIQTVTESGPAGKVHSVTLSSLQSNQTYYFKLVINQPVGGEFVPVTSDVRSFRTSPMVPNITATSWTLNRGTNLATLQFILGNSGAPATGVSISSAKIGVTQTSTILPMSLPDITSIQPALVTLTFPLAIGPSGTTMAPIIALKFAGGTVTVGARVQIQ